jgi:Flp pilus assembly protein TadG
MAKAHGTSGDMSMDQSRRSRAGGTMARLASLFRDRRGVAAIEFAFIAPILLALYFVTMEVAQAIETNKKVGRIASMVADLITQQQSVSRTDVDAIMQIGAAIIQPYNRTTPSIFVTAIEISNEASPKAKVAWSRKLVNGAASADVAKGQPISVPEKLLIAGTFLVRVEAQLDYRPVITYTANQKAALGLSAAFDNIDMGETYHLRPRMTTLILCGDC